MENQNIWIFLREKNGTGLKQLLEKEPKLAEERNEIGLSLILYAAYCGFEEGIKLIQQQKKSPLDLYEAIVVGEDLTAQRILTRSPELLNKANIDGFTPLGLACFFAKISIAELLLKLGAEPNQSSENKAKIYPINSAAAIGNIEITAMLLKSGADVNQAQASGVTALHSAVHLGNLPLTQLLLKNGANPTALTLDKKTPVDFLEVEDPEIKQSFEKALNM